MAVASTSRFQMDGALATAPVRSRPVADLWSPKGVPSPEPGAWCLLVVLQWRRAIRSPVALRQVVQQANQAALVLPLGNAQHLSPRRPEQRQASRHEPSQTPIAALRLPAARQFLPGTLQCYRLDHQLFVFRIWSADRTDTDARSEVGILCGLFATGGQVPLKCESIVRQRRGLLP